MLKKAQQQVKELVAAALDKAQASGTLPAFSLPDYVVEIPANNQNGDLATNVAMVSKKNSGMVPRELATILCEQMNLEGTLFVKVEIAGPGFINFFFANAYYAKVVEQALAQQENYGRAQNPTGQKVMVEFVSANPTGPMHIGNARGGAIGDCLAECLSWAGNDVTREFYVNDAGNQIERFAVSLEARYLQIYLGEEGAVLPEDGYQGEDIKLHAEHFAAQHGDKYVNCDSDTRRNALVDYALPLNIEGLRRDLGKYNVTYDVWFRESTLHNNGDVKKVIDLLGEKGLTYEQEGAIWYKASAFGAQKDEVLIRANGHPTYFAADIAYHYNKFVTRGFDRVINIWGADHHGHVARLKGAMDALGLDGNRLDIVLMQLVRLMRDGKLVKMSKRTGKAITLTDLIEEIPVDAARFFFNMREPNSTLDFDLDLAVEQTSQNPVYYVQYAHARICSIMKNLSVEGVTPRAVTTQELELLITPEEKELIGQLAQFPVIIQYAASKYDPAQITHFCVDLATAFHKFYNACRVKGEEASLMQARIALCQAVKITLKNALTMMKISAPDSM